jgi:hypothetical protein
VLDLLTRFEIDPPFSLVGLSLDGSSLRYVVSASSGALDVVGRGGVIVGESLPAGAGIPISGISPPARTTFGAALSAYESTVFVAGGNDATTGTPLGDLWRYDLNAGAWTFVPVNGPEPRSVIDSTFLAWNGSMIALDHHTDPRHLRLLEMRTSTGDSTVLARGWISGDVDAVFLGQGDDAELLLVTTSFKQRRFAVHVLRSEGGCRRVVHTVVGAGIAIGKPVMGTLGASVAVIEGDQIRSAFISRHSLQPVVPPHSWDDLGQWLEDLTGNDN